jgi:hypothetical protein
MMDEYAKEHNKTYDIVVKSRFDVSLRQQFNILGVFKQKEGAGRKIIFVIGGWINHKFMRHYLFDGFMFGNADVMRTVADLYKKVIPYPKDKRYAKYSDLHGDSSEYQLQKHLEANGIKLVYISKTPRSYNVLR